MYKFILIITLLIPLSSTANEIKYFKTYDDVYNDYVIRLSSGGKEEIINTKVNVIKKDINGDSKIDIWLHYSPLQCGSGSGCFGTSYINSKHGYCESSDINDYEIKKNTVIKLKCRTRK